MNPWIIGIVVGFVVQVLSVCGFLWSTRLVESTVESVVSLVDKDGTVVQTSVLPGLFKSFELKERKPHGA
jgi:hypothetical protein